ncbi:MAG: hypothetical protein ACI89L_002546 [Phycisphaerales bacterium]|jgi:hypothetical protein
MWRARAVLALLRLAVITRAWRPGRYLHWRYETVFGRGVPEARGSVRRAGLEFGRWASMMRRLR